MHGMACQSKGCQAWKIRLAKTLTLQGTDFMEIRWQLTSSPVQVMGVNGVSHHIVEDDLAGCMAALQWLAYVPAVLGSLPPTLPTTDPISRPIGYCPGPSESFNSGQQSLLLEVSHVWRLDLSAWVDLHSQVPSAVIHRPLAPANQETLCRARTPPP